MSGSSSTGPAQGSNLSSAPADTSSQTKSTRSCRRNAAALVPAAPAGVMPFTCDDRTCCDSTNPAGCNPIGLQVCQSRHLFRAPMLPAIARNNRAHNTIGPEVCTTCLPHGRAAKLGVLGIQANVAQGSGPMIQLCKDCIRDEMELYWARYGKTLGPHNLLIAPSLAHIAAWPTGAHPNDVQDLCICAHRAVGRFENSCCHACRDAAFTNLHSGYYRRAERILRNYSRDVITGAKLCRENGPSGTPATLNRRTRPLAAGLGRMCPCGNKPETQAHWITICLACMGVRIDPRQGIPAKYSPARMPKRKILLSRTAAPRPNAGIKMTKGRRGALVHHNYRVNIESGWLLGRQCGVFRQGDPFINGGINGA
jgi:hypothetical protein